MVAGPLPQLSPTTAAPASASLLQASTVETPSIRTPDGGTDRVITAGRPTMEIVIQ